ncbi:hypothetical protein [Paraburkholderia fungorum]|uniref:hypothetical protein n=1 Tax=Paraburkholderia fungorum TaxID=134537 RepID=UPI0038780F92
MLLDPRYIFPGAVVVLKFLLKLWTNQQSSKVDIVRALVVFPVDVTFLALSFIAAACSKWQITNQAPASTYMVLSAAVVYIVVIILTVVLTKESDRAYIGDRNWKALFFACPSYGLASLSLICAVKLL